MFLDLEDKERREEARLVQRIFWVLIEVFGSNASRFRDQENLKAFREYRDLDQGAKETSEVELHPLRCPDVDREVNRTGRDHVDDPLFGDSLSAVRSIRAIDSSTI